MSFWDAKRMEEQAKRRMEEDRKRRDMEQDRKRRDMEVERKRKKKETEAHEEKRKAAFERKKKISADNSGYDWKPSEFGEIADQGEGDAPKLSRGFGSMTSKGVKKIGPEADESEKGGKTTAAQTEVQFPKLNRPI